MLYITNFFNITWFFLAKISNLKKNNEFLKSIYKYQVKYYSKFYYETNHIKYFWYDRKKLTQYHYKYIIEELKKNVFKTLSLWKISIILK